MTWRDPNWKYVPAAAHETSEYLRAKFRKLIRENEARQKAEAEKVRPLKPVKAGR